MYWWAFAGAAALKYMSAQKRTGLKKQDLYDSASQDELYADQIMRTHKKNAQQKIEEVGSTMEAVQSALKMPVNELMGYAKVLGIKIDRSVDEVRWDMKIQAEKNPKGFLAGMNAPRTEMQQVLLMAEESGIIAMKGKSVTWSASGNTICIQPVGIKPLDKMVDYCSQGEGEQVYAEIERRLQALNG